VVSEGVGTTREHNYAWTRELAMNFLNGKDDGYKGMLNHMYICKCFI